ncbi:EHMT [Lepeophtheirus salmonis]|uniref:EHMT n=1 Tax=Lepeophtheirus salmonis TaxID=72036 RepID=A0A7R8CE82_LEPSM|nr:EHMT [Lepeophtheirus salmonis]CAF2782983.1 EHMT [Lepeophtheirus salmonis]
MNGVGREGKGSIVVAQVVVPRKGNEMMNPSPPVLLMCLRFVGNPGRSSILRQEERTLLLLRRHAKYMSSSIDGGSPMILEPSVTMREEPGEVFLNNDTRSFYNGNGGGDIPAQISITKINPPVSTQVSGAFPPPPPPRGNPFPSSPRSDLAGIVPKGLRPVQIRPPPLFRGGGIPGIPPPPRLQYAGIPTNIRPVNRPSNNVHSNNPILGMMNVAKKAGNTPRFSSRGSRGPSPRCKQQQQIPRSSPQPGFHHLGVPGIKNVSPVANSYRPPPMIRPGFRPVNVRVRGRPPLIKRETIVYPSPREGEPKVGEENGAIIAAKKDEDNFNVKGVESTENISDHSVQNESLNAPSEPEKNDSTKVAKNDSAKIEDDDKEPSDPEISFNLDPMDDETGGAKKEKETAKPDNPVPDEKVDQDEDKGATKFRFVRRADGKGFVKKSVKSSSNSSVKSGSVSHNVRKTYSSSVLKGIRKKKKKPAYKDDDETSSIRSDREIGNEQDVLSYLGIQRKDSTDSKKKVFGGSSGTVVSPPSSKKRPLGDVLTNRIVKRKKKLTLPKLDNFSLFLPGSTSSSISASTSVSASDEDGPQSPKEYEDEDIMCKVEENISGEGSNYDLLSRRNSGTICRAIESVGGSRVGCKNQIQSFNQLRADTRLPRKVFCEIHTERLRAHQVCGFCGEFCSHGMFYLCRPNKRYAPHVFHKSCYNKAKRVEACCHCGSRDTPAVVQMTLKMDRAPIQLLRTVSKMSFANGKKGRPSDDVEEDIITYKMANGKVISSQGLPLGLDNSILQKVLSELEDKHAPKHLTRNMYFPTKSGDAVKILQLLSQAEGHVLNCHIFAQAGTELNSFDDSGNAPIHLASMKGRTEVASSSKWMTGVGHHSSGLVKTDTKRLSSSKTTCEVLMNYGCDVNARNMNGDAPIHIALRQDHYECAVLLLMRGANTNLMNKNGQLPVGCMAKDAKCGTIMQLSTKLNAMMKNNKVHTHEKIVTNDVSKGKENCPIQCINALDNEGPPGNYVYVRNNCVTSSIPIDRDHASLQHCKCENACSSEDSCNCSKLSVKSWYDLEGKLKSSFDYKEPHMIFECNDLCQCNVSTCHNRVVQHGITSRMIVFRTENMGWGVRALKDIAKGTFVCEYVGEIISDSEADTREDSYLFDLDYREGETYCIDANRFGNIARFINHSCDPNLTPVKVFAEHQDLRFPHIALFANRDIPKGAELGFDYGEKFWVIKHKYFTCHCGSENCHYRSEI